MSTTVSTSHSAGAFVTTRWTEVLTAQAKGSPDAAEALEALCCAYWLPLYTWIRRQGRGPHDAQDLTQAFFARLLEKDWIDAANPGKGRFRTFLLVALKRFLADEWDRARAMKRGGGKTQIHFDTELAERTLLSDATPAVPEQAYDRQWAMTLLERALGRLRGEFGTGRRSAEFDILKEFLTAGRGDIPYAELAVRLGIGEGAARVAVHRLRQQFRRVFREEVARTVDRPEDVDSELRQLLAALAG